MKASPNCYIVIEHTESCKLKAYPDPKTGGAPWTCGWGSTGLDVRPGTVWSQDYANSRLIIDVERREAIANNALTVPMDQGQFDCFVDMIYNIGAGAKGVRDGIITLKSGTPSTFMRKLRTLDYDGAHDQIIKWVSPGSNVERGLRRRRTMDQALWRGLDGAEAIRLGMLV